MRLSASELVCAADLAVLRTECGGNSAAGGQPGGRCAGQRPDVARHPPRAPHQARHRLLRRCVRLGYARTRANLCHGWWSKQMDCTILSACRESAGCTRHLCMGCHETTSGDYVCHLGDCKPSLSVLFGDCIACLTQLHAVCFKMPNREYKKWLLHETASISTRTGTIAIVLAKHLEAGGVRSNGISTAPRGRTSSCVCCYRPV